MKSLHDRLLSTESMERALLKARVSEGLNIKQELCWDEFHCIRL